MPLKPHIPKNQPNKWVGINWELWNSVAAFGDPKEILEKLLADFLMDKMKDRDNYFIQTKKIIREVRKDSPKLKEEMRQRLTDLRNSLAQANAMNQHKRAENIKGEIIALENSLND